MRTQLFSLFLFLSTLSCVALPIEFLHLNTDQGLLSNQIECIFKDSRGFVWFGSNVGASRFDGYSFSHFPLGHKNERSIPLDVVAHIMEDANGNLWFFDTYKPTLYLYDEDRFVANMDSLFRSMGIVGTPSAMTLDEQGNVWLVMNLDGVYHYDLKKKQLHYLPQDDKMNHFSQGEVSSICVKNNFVWVLYASGLLERYNLTSGSVDIRNDFFVTATPFSTIQKNLFVDSDNDPWVYPGVGDMGVAYFETHSRQWTTMSKEQKPLSSYFVRSMAQEYSGTIWIANDHGGITLFDKKNGTMHQLLNDVNNARSVCQNSIISLYYDSQGVMWVGSYKNGVSYYHPNLYKFRQEIPMQQLHAKFKHLDCNVISADRQGRLWIGTNGQGLIRFDQNSGEIKHYKSDKDNPKTLSSDIITALKEDAQGVMWVGTFLGGLNAIMPSGNIIRYRPELNSPNYLSNKCVYDIYEDQNGYLWMAMLGSGIDRLNPERNRFDHYSQANTPGLMSDYMISLHRFNDTKLFASAAAGVSVIDTEKGTIETLAKATKVPELDNLYQVNSVMTDSRGIIWVGTKYGIVLYQKTPFQLTTIQLNDGMSTHDVVSLIEDNKGNVWAGTHSELLYIQVTYNNGALSYKVSGFNREDGLVGHACNPNAMYKDLKGHIYVGTTKGVVEIDPERMIVNEQKPEAKFTALFLNNKEITSGMLLSGRMVMDDHISSAKKITLPYNQTNFTLNFSSFNYIRPGKCQFRYLLRGLDNEYVTLPRGTHSLSFSNLNPGKYELLLYACNEDQVWSDKPLAVQIEVMPPLWKRWWAYLFYLLLIACAILLAVRVKLNSQKRQFERDKRVLESSKQHELDQMKISFFTNISHEFKTPITLILTPIQKMLGNNPTSEQKMLLQMMQRNANGLMDLVSDLLDFRKLDIKELKINASTGDMVSYVKDVCQSFAEHAKEKEITLSFTAHFDHLLMDFDVKKMHKIISNLLSNAVKYTPAGGKVEVELTKVEQLATCEEQLAIQIRDTGVGIPREEQIKIFERFHRVPDSELMASGTGLGLHLVNEYVKLHRGSITVVSEKGKGSIFTVTLPIVMSQGVASDQVLQEHSIMELPEAKATTEKESDKELPILLIADDNADFRNFIKSLFMNSYQVITAQDGAEAYERTLELFPDIILSDIMMPKMDGYELCRKLKGDIRTSHIPIILLTAKDSDESHYEGISVGADDYISKPFNIEMLSLKISKIVERQKMRQDSFKKKITIAPSEIEVESMDEKFVKRAVELVEQNISNPDFLVSHLCEEMNMSRVYFYKKILALTDKTPSEFIRYIRLQRAAELLEKSQMFVNEVAYQVGFNDPKYFRKYFKEEFGVTPIEYKKRFVNNEVTSA